MYDLPWLFTFYKSSRDFSLYFMLAIKGKTIEKVNLVTILTKFKI